MPAPNVVAAMIVKNEAHRLRGAFKSALKLVDAFQIVDTGSTDGTADLARELGEKHNVPVDVIEDAWDDDFARSRNVGLARVDTIWPEAAWVLTLDGDDVLRGAKKLAQTLVDLGDEVTILALFSRSKRPDGTVESAATPRLWRRSLGIRWQYPMHNQIVVGPEAVVNVVDLSVSHIEHTGYITAAGLQQNAERTVRIAESWAPEDPESLVHKDFHRMRALRILGRTEEAAWVALDLVGEHHEHLRTSEPWVMAAMPHFLAGDADEALLLLADAVAHTTQADPTLWYNVLLAGALGYIDATCKLAQGETQAVSSSAGRAYKILKALQGAGVLPQDFSPQATDLLKRFSQERH